MSAPPNRQRPLKALCTSFGELDRAPAQVRLDDRYLDKSLPLQAAQIAGERRLIQACSCRPVGSAFSL
jgi:hypothetical protein